jgi:hypothetical protein
MVIEPINVAAKNCRNSSAPEVFIDPQRLLQSSETERSWAESEVGMSQMQTTAFLRDEKVDVLNGLDIFNKPKPNLVETYTKQEIIDDAEIQKHISAMQNALSHLFQLRNQSEQHASVISDAVCDIAKRTIDLIDQANTKEVARYTISASGYSFGQYSFDDIERDQQWLNSPRKNKYGLVMEALEQELDDIKLGRLSIESYDPNKHPNAVQFFWDVYKPYIDGKVIYQRDLMSIDARLLNNIKNNFKNRKEVEVDDGNDELKKFCDINSLLPSREYVSESLKQIVKNKPKSVEQLNYNAELLIRRHS